jgi:hypothetical protein
MSKEAMKLALDALECALSDDKPYIDKSKKAIKALEEALATQEQDVPEVGFGNIKQEQGEPVIGRQTGWLANRDQYAFPVLFNPYTGQPRDVRDVQSDPQGVLIVPVGKVEVLAAAPQPSKK